MSTCVECSAATDNLNCICDTCAPLYRKPEPPLVGDECPCPACRSDMAKIVPCLRAVQ